MKRLVAVAAAFVSVSAFAAEGDVHRGLQNLAQIQIIANALEQQKAVGKPLKINGELADPWRTPYRLTIDGTNYRIVSAGADRKYDEKLWGRPGQFRNFDDDVVFSNGRFVRSNRNWLALQATEAEAGVFKNLRDVEIFFMLSRHPSMTTVSAAGVTNEAIKMVAENIDRYREVAAAPPVDGWGTPMRLIFEKTSFRVVSAGSDREFAPETWKTSIASVNPADDIVFENGTLVRRFDPRAFLEAAPAIVITAIPQPVDESLTGKGKWLQVGGDTVAPKVVTRVEPLYPESYRKGKMAGLVTLQIALSETGAIEDVRVLQSVAPEIDLAAIGAAKQWKFEPATKGGKPVPSLFQLTINFKLS